MQKYDTILHCYIYNLNFATACVYNSIDILEFFYEQRSIQLKNKPSL